MDQIRDTFYEEKISIHPDLGDLRKSTDKALPAPPVTPKRVLMKYRFSAIFPIAFSVASFVLMLVLVLAGKESGTFGGQYLLALDTSVFMQRTQTQQPIAVPITPSAGAVPDAVVPDIYYLYLQNICSGYTDTTTNSIIIANCESYTHANNRISAYLASTSATSSASTPSLTLLTSALETLSTSLSTTRHVLTAFLIVALSSTALSALSALPAIVFPHSPLLAYCNIFWPCLGSTSIFIAAGILSVLVSGVVSVAGGVVGVVGLRILPGKSVVLVVWLGWAFGVLSTVYWVLIWWVGVRRWGVVRKRRREEDVGRWRGLCGRRLRESR